MTTSEQLEREAERTRSEIADTLAELRERMTPGQMLDQVLDYARDGSAGEFTRNFGRQVVSNPIPVALITAGVGWLAFGGTRAGGDFAGDAAASWVHRASYRAEDWKQRAGETGEEWSERTQRMATEAAGRAQRAALDWRRRAGAAGSEIGEAAGEWAHDAQLKSEDWLQRAGETAEEWATRVEAMASEAADRARRSAAAWRRGAQAAGSAVSHGANHVYDRASHGTHQAVDAGRRFAGYLGEEPLVLAGIGLALGAVLGAAIPESDQEKKWMGRQSDAFKARVGEAAEEEWHRGKQVAGQAWQAGKEEAERQGLASDDASLIPAEGSDPEPDASRRPSRE